MSGVSPCPNCGGTSLHRGPETSSGGGHAPSLLPDLGKWWQTARMSLVVCRDCGLMRFFASPEARAKLRESEKWKSA